MFNPQQQQQQLMDQQMLQIMHDAAKIKGFQEQSRKQLKDISTVLMIKENINNKNELSLLILQQLFLIYKDCSLRQGYPAPTLVKCYTPAINNTPILNQIFIQFCVMLQNQQKTQQMNPHPVIINQVIANNNQFQNVQLQQPFQINQQDIQFIGAPSNQNAQQCICLYLPKLRSINYDTIDNVISCQNQKCEKKFHMTCLKIKSIDQKNIFECPFCILQNIDPLHKVISVLQEPMVLKSGAPTQSKFFLKDEDYNLLTKNSAQYGFEIRCIRIDEKIMCESTWPDYGEMEINQHKVMEFKPLQSNSSLKKRKDEKFYLKTPQILAEQNQMNIITIREFFANNQQKQNFKIQDNAVHMFGIYLVKKITSLELIKQIITNFSRPIQQCKDLIKEQLKQNDIKEDVEIDKLRITLNCNFDFKMIITPAKGKWCRHAQCFSLENMILMTENQIPRKWKCPICKLKCHDIIVDQYVLKIIKEVKDKQLKILEVTFDNEGEYNVQINNKKEEQSDDDDSDNISKKKQNAHQSGKQQNNTKIQDSVIILSDEELEQQEKQEKQQEKKQVIQFIDIEKKQVQMQQTQEIMSPNELQQYKQQVQDLGSETQNQNYFFPIQTTFDNFIKNKNQQKKEQYQNQKIIIISQNTICKNIEKQLFIFLFDFIRLLLESNFLDNLIENQLKNDKIEIQNTKNYVIQNNQNFLIQNNQNIKYQYLDQMNAGRQNVMQNYNPFIQPQQYFYQQQQQEIDIRKMNQAFDQIQYPTAFQITNTKQIPHQNQNQQQSSKFKDRGLAGDPIDIDDD